MKKTHNIYVIELDPAVLQIKKFRKANPQYIEGKPCVYVGMTSLPPKERFKQHKDGYKKNSYAMKYGHRLKPRQYKSHNPMSKTRAAKMEIEKARRLRKKGWAVWQK